MKKISLLTLGVLLASLVSFADEGNAKDGDYTKEYQAQLHEGEKSRQVAQEREKESQEWKKHKEILNAIDRRDRN